MSDAIMGKALTGCQFGVSRFMSVIVLVKSQRTLDYAAAASSCSLGVM
jgi:hypothetical protein